MLTKELGINGALDIPDGVRNIMVVGKTKCGKTTLVKNQPFVTSQKYKHVQASEFIKTRYPQGVMEYGDYVNMLTQKSVELLYNEPDACVNFIRHKYGDSGLVIDGFRNVGDFVKMFDMKNDYVVFAINPDHEKPTPFDCGVDVIRGYVEWLEQNFGFTNCVEVNVL